MKPHRSRMRPGRLPVVVLLIACLLSAGLAGGVAYFFISRTRKAAVAGNGKGKKDAKSKKNAPKPKKVAFNFSLGETLVNLADDGKLRFAKATIVIGVDNAKLEEKMESQQPVLRDAVIKEISSRTFVELHSSKGREKLRNELVTKLSAALEDGNVLKVYFDSFVMQ